MTFVLLVSLKYWSVNFFGGVYGAGECQDEVVSLVGDGCPLAESPIMVQ